MTEFEQFIERNSNLIHQIAHRYSVKNYTHEDLYQEGLMKLFEVFEQYDPKYEETTFIYSILPNFYKNVVKENTRQYNQNYDKSGQMLSDIKNFDFDSLSDGSESLYDKVHKEKVLAQIFELLEQEKYRDGFVELLYGKTYDEVAEMYGVSKQNIYQRFQVFLEKVRNTVEIDDEMSYNILESDSV